LKDSRQKTKAYCNKYGDHYLAGSIYIRLSRGTEMTEYGPFGNIELFPGGEVRAHVPDALPDDAYPAGGGMVLVVISKCILADGKRWDNCSTITAPWPQNGTNYPEQ
jgi:hypothetical protein